MISRYLVMVTDYFPPDPGNRARRMYERARYLAHHGFRVLVVVPRRQPHTQTDPGPAVPRGVHVLRVRPLGSRVFPSADASAYRFSAMPLFRVLRPFFGHLRFVPPAIATLVRVREARRAVLYTMSNPTALHLVGIASAFRFRAWIAELRDPISTWESGRFSVWRPLLPLYERLIMERATLVVYRSGLPMDPLKLQTQYPHAMLHQLPDYGVDYSTFEESDNRWSRDESTLVGIYAGGYYAGLDPQPLFHAATRFTESHIPLRLTLFGDRPDCSLEEFPHVTFCGKVPYWTLAGEYARADFLILFTRVDHGDTADFYPSKYAELVAAGKPILLIGSSPTALSREIVSNRLGFFASNESDSIVAALEDIHVMISQGDYNAAYRVRNKAKFSNEPSERAFCDAICDIG